MDLEFFMAWGGGQSLADSLGRYPDCCFRLGISPGNVGLLLAELHNVTTHDAVTVGTRTDTSDYFADSGIVDLELLAQLLEGNVDFLTVSQTFVDGSRVWVTTSTPEFNPEPGNDW